VTVKEFKNLPPNEITVLSTGSQGEPLAALSRIADGSHSHIKIIPGDTIVFSSSPIPGNQEAINRIINKLYKAGCNVIVNSPLTDTHTSGHAGETELMIMLSLTKPKHFMPIHGLYSMLKRHAQLAVETGVAPENCHILDNGEVLTFSENKVFSHYAVQSGSIYIDSDRFDIDNTVIKERKILSDDGMVAIVFTAKNRKLTKKPNVVSRGFIYLKDSEALLSEIESRAEQIYNDYFRSTKRFHANYLNNIITHELGNYIYEKTEKRPMIIPVIMNY
jgi:ribonuclease J